MKHIERIPRIAALLVLVLAFCPPLRAEAAAGSLRALDSGGHQIVLSAPARRLVSLSPVATEVLFAIGAGEQLVGDTTYCNYPAAALALPKVGGFAASTISVENILALKPDLVVGAGSVHARIGEALARLGIPLFSYDPGDFQEIAREMEALGVLSGRAESARAVGAEMLETIASVERLTAGLQPEERPSVFWEMYDDPLMTCGSATFQHAIVEAAGGRDIFSDIEGPWPQVSAEEVIARAPEVIMGADDHGDAMTVAQITGRPGWSRIPAVRAGRVILLPADPVSRPGPRIAQGLLLAARALHPALFP